MTPPACDSYRVNQLDSLRFGLFGVGYQGRLLSSGDAHWLWCVRHNVLAGRYRVNGTISMASLR